MAGLFIPVTRLVRPNETRDVSPASRVSTPLSSETGSVVLRFGENGRGKTFRSDYRFAVKNYMTAVHREVDS